MSKVTTSKRTIKSTKSTKTTKTTRTTMNDTITSLLKKNPSMGPGEVYLHVIKSKGFNPNNINLTSFFSKMGAYPSYRSVYESTRSVKSRNSRRKVTSAKTARPARKSS